MTSKKFKVNLMVHKRACGIDFFDSLQKIGTTLEISFQPADTQFTMLNLSKKIVQMWLLYFFSLTRIFLFPVSKNDVWTHTVKIVVLRFASAQPMLPAQGVCTASRSVKHRDYRKMSFLSTQQRSHREVRTRNYCQRKLCSSSVD